MTLWIGFRNKDRIDIRDKLIRIAGVESDHWYSARNDIAAKLGCSPMDLECLDSGSREAIALTFVSATLVGREAENWYFACQSPATEEA